MQSYMEGSNNGVSRGMFHISHYHIWSK